MSKRKIWKLLTLLIGTALMLSFIPEVRVLGFFVDAIGLDVLFLFVEGYIVAIFTLFYLSCLKPALLWINSIFSKIDPYYFIPTRKQVAECPQIAFHSVPLLVTGATVVLSGALAFA